MPSSLCSGALIAPNPHEQTLAEHGPSHIMDKPAVTAPEARDARKLEYLVLSSAGVSHGAAFVSSLAWVGGR